MCIIAVHFSGLCSIPIWEYNACRAPSCCWVVSKFYHSDHFCTMGLLYPSPYGQTGTHPNISELNTPDTPLVLKSSSALISTCYVSEFHQASLSGSHQSEHLCFPSQGSSSDCALHGKASVCSLHCVPPRRSLPVISSHQSQNHSQARPPLLPGNGELPSFLSPSQRLCNMACLSC